MFKSISKFINEFAKVAPKFEWYFNRKQYVVKNVPVVIRAIVGTKIGVELNEVKEYTPLTALVENLTGKYFEMDRFDVAAAAVEMSPNCVLQIIDACDEWPDRLHGYTPKKYEQKLRDDILQLCFEEIKELPDESGSSF